MELLSRWSGQCTSIPGQSCLPTETHRLLPPHSAEYATSLQCTGTRRVKSFSTCPLIVWIFEYRTIYLVYLLLLLKHKTIFVLRDHAALHYILALIFCPADFLPWPAPQILATYLLLWWYYFLALFKFKRIIRTPRCNLLLNWHEASGIWCPRAQGTWTPYGSLKARWVGQQLMDGLVAPYGAPGKTTTLSYCWLGTEIAFKDRLFNQAILLWITTTPHRINVQIFKNSVWNWAPLSTGQCPGSWWWLNHCNDLIIMHCKKEQEGFKNHK